MQQWPRRHVGATSTEERHTVGRLDGKVAFITGAARGQGRSHAVRLAEEGADIIGVDLCGPLESVPYELADETDLEETVQMVERQSRRMIGSQADVRDFEGLKAALDDGVAQLGRLDIVIANAGIVSFAPTHELTAEQWGDMIDIALTGAFNTAKAAIPHLLPQQSGVILITSSGAGFRGAPMLAHYCAAKHGVVGLMRALAVELAPSNIRVNTVHPTNVDTPMIQNDAVYRLFRPDLESPGRDDISDAMATMNSMTTPWVDPIDISNAMVYLASDEARYITGVAMPVDAGQGAK
jgi:SDR family mycofactocin-dependent oxidoreductase